jgi:hypothetical protein
LDDGRPSQSFGTIYKLADFLLRISMALNTSWFMIQHPPSEPVILSAYPPAGV